MKIVKTYTTPNTTDFIPLYDQIMRAPSVLIAGTPGSGKSVLLNGLIYNTLAKYAPSAKMFFIDPKRVELSRYSALPHCAGIAKDPRAACDLLEQVAYIMENRYKDMERAGQVKSSAPPVFVFIDEIADIMLSDYQKPFTKLLQHILQLGRAARITVVYATQIPARRILPPQIHAVTVEKIALRCVSAIESRQVINKPGAETLPRYGQAIWLGADGYQNIKNIPLISDDKINARIAYWKRQRGKIHITL